ncbi:MAG: 3-phosphoshikimate 1-carboxyvinyltransferase, partial [Acutalibacteraceae bacterium]
MNLVVKSSGLSGSISAISSKSYAHRALICAALADKSSKIRCDTLSNDILATVNCLNGLGAEIYYSDKVFTVNPIDISKAKQEIDCGESGSTLRFILPIIGALGLSIKIIMHGRLPERPLSPLYEQMQKNGCEFEKADNYLIVKGKLKAADYEIEGNISSQFVTGLLFSLPLIEGKSRIIIKNKFESYSYVLMTLSVLKDYGINYRFENNVFELIDSKYHSNDTVVEGDWSNAAFWLCAGALSKSGVTVSNLNFNSP